MIKVSITEEARELVSKFGTLEDLNKSLDKKNKIKLVSVDTFMNSEPQCRMDKDIQLLSSIDIKVNNNELVYTIDTIRNKKVVLKIFSNDYERTFITGSRILKNKNIRDYRPIITVELSDSNPNTYLEKWLGIINQIVLRYTLPETFANYKLEVNCIDLSGSAKTASYCDIPKWNFNPYNLEWTIKCRNTMHAKLLFVLYKRLGNQVRSLKLSANNNLSFWMDFVDTHSNDEIKEVLKLI